MINLNSYITEKLKINKNLEFDNLTTKLEEDILTYLKQFKKYDSSWDIKIGELLKEWVNTYNVKSLMICGYEPYVIDNYKNHEIFDKVFKSKEWENHEVYKSNHTKVFSKVIDIRENTKYINIWYDEYGFEIHIDGVYILLEKKNLKSI